MRRRCSADSEVGVSGWFSCNETDRTLSAVERACVEALTQALDEVRPAQVEPRETCLTTWSEDGSLLCIVPHRSLGGLALVAAVGSHEATLLWAQIGSLFCCQCDLDDGHRAGTHAITAAGQGLTILGDHFRAELKRALVMRTDAMRSVAEVLLPESTGVVRIAVLGDLARPSLRAAAMSQLRDEFTIRFTDAAPPPVMEPSHAASWFFGKHAAEQGE